MYNLEVYASRRIISAIQLAYLLSRLFCHINCVTLYRCIIQVEMGITIQMHYTVRDGHHYIDALYRQRLASLYIFIIQLEMGITIQMHYIVRDGHHYIDALHSQRWASLYRCIIQLEMNITIQMHYKVRDGHHYIDALYSQRWASVLCTNKTFKKERKFS